MTTVICRKIKWWYELAADTRINWWNIMLKEQNKIITWIIKLKSWEESEILLSYTWDVIHDNLINKVLEDIKSLPDSDRPSDKYFYFKLIHNSLKEISWIKDMYYTIIIVTSDEAVIINDSWFIENIYDFWSIWSWYELATWIYLANPDLDITEYFKLISTKDIKTSHNFTYKKIIKHA